MSAETSPRFTAGVFQDEAVVFDSVNKSFAPFGSAKIGERCAKMTAELLNENPANLDSFTWFPQEIERKHRCFVRPPKKD